MSRTRFLITILICGMGAIAWLAVSVSSQSVTPTQVKAVSATAGDEYVGSEACKDCHEDQFKAFEKSSHAELAKMGSWKNKVTGCEACHEGGAHPDLVCTNCHQPARMNTVDPQTLRVSVKSCGGAEGCHITTTTDDGGILNFELDQKKANSSFVCSKCHISFGKQGPPLEHGEETPGAANSEIDVQPKSTALAITNELYRFST